jgi:hypothetical protein
MKDFVVDMCVAAFALLFDASEGLGISRQRSIKQTDSVKRKGPSHTCCSDLFLRVSDSEIFRWSAELDVLLSSNIVWSVARCVPKALTL